MKFILLFIFLLPTTVLFGQKKGQLLTDSLLKELAIIKDHKDTIQVAVLNKLGKNLSSSNTEESIKFSKQGLSLAEQLKWKKGMGDSYNNIGNAYCNQGDFTEALKDYSASLNIRSEINDNIGVAACYNNIGNVYIYKGDYPNALKNNVASLKIRENASDKKGMASCYNSIGAIYISEGNYPEALSIYFSALKILTEIGDKEAIASNYHNTGVIYKHMGMLADALKNYILALKIDEELNDAKSIATDYSNIGNLYLELENYQDAFKNYFASLQLFKKSGNKNGIATAYNNIGITYLKQGNFPEAIANYNAGMKIDSEIGNAPGIAAYYTNLGAVYEEMKDYPGALKNYFISLKKHLVIGDTDNLCRVYGNIGLIYYKQKQYKDAEQYKIKEEQLAEKTGSIEFIKSANETLSEIYKNTGKYDNALSCYKAYITARDSLNNKENTKKILQLQMQYNFDKKEAAATAAHEKQIAITNVANNARLRTWAITGVAALVICFITFYFYRKRENDKLQLQMVNVKQEALIAQLDTHFISDSIDSINGFMEDNDLEAASKYLLKFSRLVRSVLGNSFEKRVLLRRELDNLNDYFRLAKLRFNDRQISMKVVVDEAIDPDNTLVPPMVLQVLTSNAIQHAFKNTESGIVKIEVRKKEGFVHCIVTDNGIGRDATVKKQNSGRRSYGSGLAENLIKIWDDRRGKTSYKITDMKDANGIACGTVAEFSYPFMVNG